TPCADPVLGEIGAAPLLDPAIADAYTTPASGATRHEVVFVDPTVTNSAQIVSDLQSQSPGAQIDVYILDPTQNGVDQITQVLATYKVLDAIQIVSHGTAGAIEIGDQWLTPSAVDAQSAEIQSWASALAPDADLLIYGCDVAASAAGQQLIQQLSVLT